MVFAPSNGGHQSAYGLSVWMVEWEVKIDMKIQFQGIEKVKFYLQSRKIINESN